MSSIRDPALRRRALARRLGERGAREVVAALAELIDAHVAAPSAELAEALGALAGALTEPKLVPYVVRAGLYTAAREADRGEIACMLFEGRPVAELVDDEDAAAERPLMPRGRPVSLGERKSLARGQRREILQQLLRDPHPDVVEILLGNPMVTERDVLVIATRRPAPPAALAVVATFDRWIVRHRVKRALVLNPYTPTAITVRLAATMHAGELRRVASDANLPDALREQAEALLARAPP